MAKNILIAVDSSPQSDKAVEFALNLYRPHDKLCVLQVVEKGIRGRYLGTSDLEGHELQKAEQTKTKHSQFLKNRGVENFEYIIAKASDARECIVEHTKLKNTDLLILGSRGLSELTSLLLGSTTSYCLNHVDCTVLVVK